jgi:hypothetical protein
MRLANSTIARLRCQIAHEWNSGLQAKVLTDSVIQSLWDLRY